MSDTTKILTQATELLLQFTTSTPIVFGAIFAISNIIKGVTGHGPTLAECIAIVKAVVAANKKFGEDEVARLESMIG